MMRTHLFLTCGSALALAMACSSESKDGSGDAGGANTGMGGVNGATNASTGTSNGSTDASTTSSNSAVTGVGGATSAATNATNGTVDGTVNGTTGTSTGTSDASTSTSAGGTATTTGTTGAGGTGNTSTGFSCDPATGEVPSLGLDTVGSGFDTPLYVAQAPGDTDRLFVVEQQGIIQIIEGGSTVGTPFLDITDSVLLGEGPGNEQGLFAMAFHPDYQTNGLFYVHYSAENGTHGLGAGDTVISEFSASGNTADTNSERVLITHDQPNPNHNGGMIAFGPNDGFLYIALGDGGGGGDPDDNGQTMSSLLGGMLRIDVDARDAGEYGIPAGNMAGGAPELWSKGLRNPWRFSFDPCTGDAYIADVGQNDYEEVNVEPAGMAGRNYGWNVTEGLACYNANSCERSAFVEPVIDYGRGDGASVTGGYVYRGSANPALRGTYFYADYQSGNFWSFQSSGGSITNAQEVTFDRTFQGGGFDGAGIVSFGQDNAGELYVVVRGAGEILKIVPR